MNSPGNGGMPPLAGREVHGHEFPMQTLAAVDESPGLTSPETGKRRARRLLIVVILGIVLAGAGVSWFLIWRQQRAVSLRALGLFPEELSSLPSRSSSELPEARLHHACVRIATRLGTDLLRLKSGMEKIALEMEEEGRIEASSMERAGGAMFLYYLAQKPADPAVLWNRQCLGLRLVQNHWYAEGEAELRAVLAFRRAVQGPDDPEMLRNEGWIASALCIQKRYDEALPVIRAALAASDRALGPDHLVALGQRGILAYILSCQSRYAEEEPLRRILLRAQEKSKTPDEKHIAEARYDLAVCLHAQSKDEEEAKALARESLSYFKKAKLDFQSKRTESLLKEMGP
jgi:tetratricopeptide (TPR) repeat protein